MRNDQIKALILAAIVTVTSAAFAGCSKSSDDELITVNESDLDSMSNEEIESIIVHNAEVIMNEETTAAKDEKPVIDIWKDVTITPNNEKKELGFNFEYTGDNEDVKKAIADEKINFREYNYYGDRKDVNGRQVTVSCVFRGSDQPFELASLESEYTVSGAAEAVYTPEQYKSITNIEEFENYCDEEIIKYALEYPTLMNTPYSEEELRNITDRRSYVGGGFCREFVLPDGTVVGYTGMLYSVNNEYLIFEEDFVGYNDDRPADEIFHSSFVRVE